MDIRFEGTNELKEFVMSLTKYLANPETTFKKCSLIMLRDIDRHFKNEEGPDSKWPELSPYTILRRRQGTNKSRGIMILQDNGTMKNSINRIVSNTGVEIGTNIPYAKQHQKGDPKKRIPQRTFIWLSPQAEEDIVTVFIKDLRYTGDKRQ